MSNQPVVPAKKIELTSGQKFENMLFNFGAMAHILGALWWYIGLCKAQIKAHKRISAPVTIELFGSDPEQGREILTEYGIRSAYGSLQWAVIENKVALRLMFLVSKASFDYADNILSQYAGQTFDIMTNAGCKRGQGIRRPYAQRQPSQKISQSAKNPTKLGKTYQ